MLLIAKKLVAGEIGVIAHGYFSLRQSNSDCSAIHLSGNPVNQDLAPDRFGTAPQVRESIQ